MTETCSAVLRSRRNCSSDGAERTDDGRAFDARAAVTGKARSPSLVRRVDRKVRGVQRREGEMFRGKCSGGKCPTLGERERERRKGWGAAAVAPERLLSLAASLPPPRSVRKKASDRTNYPPPKPSHRRPHTPGHLPPPRTPAPMKTTVKPYSVDSTGT